MVAVLEDELWPVVSSVEKVDIFYANFLSKSEHYRNCTQVDKEEAADLSDVQRIYIALSPGVCVPNPSSQALRAAACCAVKPCLEVCQVGIVAL